MIDYGLEVQVHELEDGNPVITSQIQGRNRNKVLLVYSHYDVQPPDPLDEWESDPFSGRVTDGRIYGRGASDSKGNVMAYLSAVRTLARTGGLPITVSFLFEGEEEIGSPHLASFVEDHRSDLMADAVICADSERDPSGRPMISLGMKGLVYVEFRCRKSGADMHSSKASLLESAPWRLVKALNEISDGDGCVLVPGWDEGIVKPGDEELELLRRIPFDEAAVKEEYGVSRFLKERHGLDALRAYLYEPTANIAGLTAGYQGVGSKTVLPGEARAKMDFRIVYNQSADRCFELLSNHLVRKGFADVEASCLTRLEPSSTPLDAPIVKAAAEAARAAYRAEPVIYPKHHASGPDYIFTKNLGLHSIWTGCAPDPSGAHAPNEFIGIEDYRLGIIYACELISRFALRDERGSNIKGGSHIRAR